MARLHEHKSRFEERVCEALAEDKANNAQCPRCSLYDTIRIKRQLYCYDCQQVTWTYPKASAAVVAEGKRLALAVVAAWESGDLAGAVNELRKWAESI